MIYEFDHGYHVDMQGGNLVVGFYDPNGGDYYEMNPMQYTGLKDKNGNEIYEGDILGNPMGLKGVVEFYGGKYVWKYINKKGMEILATMDPGLMKIKLIIGNIHENPELLDS